MKRKAVGSVLALTLGLLAAPLAAEAQQAGRIFRLGMLAQSASVPSDQRTSGFLILGERSFDSWSDRGDEPLGMAGIGRSWGSAA